MRARLSAGELSIQNNLIQILKSFAISEPKINAVYYFLIKPPYNQEFTDRSTH